jgi:hypothetical protein
LVLKKRKNKNKNTSLISGNIKLSLLRDQQQRLLEVAANEGSIAATLEVAANSPKEKINNKYIINT